MTVKRPITVDDLWAMERLSEPKLSPDGERVAFVVTTYSFDENKGAANLWIVDADGSGEPRAITTGPGTRSAPAWSPDGRSIAFVHKLEKDDPAQLYRIDIEGGEPERLIELPVSAERPTWFPDGRRIAFAARTYPDVNDDLEALAERVQHAKDDKTQAKITDRRLLRFWDRYRTDGRVPHVFVLDLESGDVTDLMPGFDQLAGFDSFSWALSPEGTEIAFEANVTPPPWQELDFDVHLLSIGSGEMRSITEDNPAWDGDPIYSPDGRYLIYTRGHRIQSGSEFGRLVRYHRESGEIVELTADWDGDPENAVVPPDGESIVFQSLHDGRRHVFAMPMEGGEPRVIGEGGNARDATAGPGGRIVYLRQDTQRPDDLYRVDLDGGDPARLTRFNEERLAGLDLGTTGELRVPGAGGDAIQTHVVYPPGFDPDLEWPLVLVLHGGPHLASIDDFHYRWNSALLASRGYVVASPNFHGSNGWGQAFADAIQGDHGTKPFEDVMAVTDALIARGFIDESRMAAAGGSYGGYLVCWIMGHTDRFAAIINHAGVYDLTNQFASDYPWTRGESYGSVPWEDPERIDRSSPSRFAKNFETPTLILHGELDYRVPVTQGINLHNVLGGKGVPSRIVIFPEENHWVLKPQAAKIWWDEVFGWLDRWIGRGTSGP